MIVTGLFTAGILTSFRWNSHICITSLLCKKNTAITVIVLAIATDIFFSIYLFSVNHVRYIFFKDIAIDLLQHFLTLQLIWQYLREEGSRVFHSKYSFINSMIRNNKQKSIGKFRPAVCLVYRAEKKQPLFQNAFISYT